MFIYPTQTTREFKSFVMQISLHFDIKKNLSRDCKLNNDPEMFKGEGTKTSIPKGGTVPLPRSSP